MRPLCNSCIPESTRATGDTSSDTDSNNNVCHGSDPATDGLRGRWTDSNQIEIETGGGRVLENNEISARNGPKLKLGRIKPNKITGGMGVGRRTRSDWSAGMQLMESYRAAIWAGTHHAASRRWTCLSWGTVGLPLLAVPVLLSKHKYKESPN